ncbi:MAG: tetratricopeptide repeat protein [Deltaproteobacteria bacterium]|nr:tetratricopeptide repeat protein [Deltaproteobacteria bacterium]
MRVPLEISTARAQEPIIARLREAAQAQPRNPEARHELGMALLRAGRFGEARRELEQAASLGRNAPELLFDLARVAFAEGNYRNAIAVCKRLRRLHSASPLGHACEAWAELSRGRVALALYAIEKAGDHPEAWLARAEAHRLQGAWEEATQAFERARQSESTRDRAELGLAKLYASRGRKEEAIALLRQLLERDPENPDAAYELGRLVGGEEGRTWLMRAARARPAWPEAQTALGEAFLSASALDEAEAAFQQALSARPEHAPALSGLGRVQLARKEFSRAESTLRRALALVPNDAQAALALADALAHLGRTEEAFENYRSAFSMDPRNPTPLLRAARLAIENKRDVLASGFLDSVLRHHPAHPEALVLYGEVMRLRGDRARAREFFRQALERGAPERERIEAALREL